MLRGSAGARRCGRGSARAARACAYSTRLCWCYEDFFTNNRGSSALAPRGLLRGCLAVFEGEHELAQKGVEALQLVTRERGGEERLLARLDVDRRVVGVLALRRQLDQHAAAVGRVGRAPRARLSRDCRAAWSSRRSRARASQQGPRARSG